MRIKLLLSALLVAVLAACSSGSGSSGASSDANPTPTAATASAGHGSVDCAKINTAARELLELQYMAQLRTPDAVAQVKTHQIGNLDLDKFLAAMHDLHALDSLASPLGDPKPAIDFYETAGKAAQVLFATDPMTQAAIDTYNQSVGTVAEFLGKQITISAAMGAAGC
jgi:hypothetical protein